MKSGLKTTELWITVITSLLGVLQVIPLPIWAYPVLTGVYTISRGLAKLGILGGGAKVIAERIPEK